MQSAVATGDKAFAAHRRLMVDSQIRTFDVTDPRVVQAFDRTPREAFLPEALQAFCYSDAALKLNPSPDGTARVLLQPMHLARLIQAAAVRSTDKVLVVAGERGYGAALLAGLAASVVSLESDPALTQAAAEATQALGLTAVVAVTGDLARGYPAGSPYDVILVQGAVETHLEALFEQLGPEGRLLAIETSTGGRVGRGVRFDRRSGEVSARFLFDANSPVLAAFRAAPAFVF